MEREIVLAIKDDVSEERFDYLARFIKQGTREIEEIQEVYVVKKEEQEEWRL